MIIKRETYDIIINSYPPVPPENGGILGSKNGVVCEYLHDSGSCEREAAVYSPNVALLNRQIEVWANDGICFSGIVHSHMIHETRLSVSDKEYIISILSAMPEDITELYFPVVFPECKKIISYSAKKEKESVLIGEDEIIMQ